MATPSPSGFDLDALAAWSEQAGIDLGAPLRAEVLTGGHSNITAAVTDADGRRCIVRRPPLHSVLPTAHDVLREHRILAALAPTPVPVPPVLGASADADVLGAPFFVMELVDGVVAHDTELAAAGLTAAGRARSGLSQIDALVALHDVVPDDVGLGDLGRTEEYVERQLRRWLRQLLATRPEGDAGLERVHDLLAARVPRQGEARIVHGDFRLGNCILDRDGEVQAVLDWELCTLGDPLADVGYVLAMWAEPGDVRTADADLPSTLPGFASRADLLRRYEERSGRVVGDVVDFFMSLAFWRLACILVGVHARETTGAAGDRDDLEPEQYLARIEACTELALQHAERA